MALHKYTQGTLDVKTVKLRIIQQQLSRELPHMGALN